jgi:hypothetical protein
LPQAGTAREQPLSQSVLNPESGRCYRVLAASRQSLPVRYRKEGNTAEFNTTKARVRIEDDIEKQMPAFMRREAREGPAEK